MGSCRHSNDTFFGDTRSLTLFCKKVLWFSQPALQFKYLTSNGLFFFTNILFILINIDDKKKEVFFTPQKIIYIYIYSKTVHFGLWGVNASKQMDSVSILFKTTTWEQVPNDALIVQVAFLWCICISFCSKKTRSLSTANRSFNLVSCVFVRPVIIDFSLWSLVVQGV